MIVVVIIIIMIVFIIIIICPFKQCTHLQWGWGADLHRGRGGGQEDGIAMICFPITFILSTTKNQIGGGGGLGVNGDAMPPPPPPIVTPLRIYSWIFLRCYVVRV